MVPIKRYILLVSIIWLAACGSTPEANLQPLPSPSPLPTAVPFNPTPTVSPSTPTAGPVIAQAANQRETSPQVAEAALVELVTGNTAFAFDLYQAIRAGEDNLFYSPYSISVALAMMYAGARNNTQQQMAEILHYPLPQDQLHPTFNALDLRLTGRSPDNQAQAAENFRLNIVNAIWGQQGYSFQPEYLDTIARNYGAGLRLLDFMDEQAREEARLTINQWVSEQTEGKIAELVPQETLTEDTRLVLTNAIYFMAEWEYPFDQTTEGPFSLFDGSQVNVPMMSRRAGFGYAEGTGYQAVELPYKGQRMRLVALLPAPDQFETLESSLNGEQVTMTLQALEPTDMKLSMPKFEYEASLTLAETLAGMGMPDAFTSQADFSGISDSGELFISEIIHKAFVAVNEIGTEAGAATGAVASIRSKPAVEITLDRPFIYLIYDSHSGTILFIGRVTNPAG